MSTTLESPPLPNPPDLWPTHGALVCNWIEQMLVHGEGDKYGQPFRLRPHDRWFIYKWYEYETKANGEFRRWRYDNALRELAKGGAKTEVGAAIGLAEFAGPVAPIAPNVPVAAASFEQADLLFGRAKQMATHDNSPLLPFIEAYDTEMLLKEKKGRIFRIAAQAGTNDGGLPTLILADEVHEWTGRRERVHLVLTGNASKRNDAHGVINVTTPGHDTDSIAGRLHEKGIRGEDPRFLHQWITADPSLDLANRSQLRLAVEQANPWAEPDHLDRLCRRYDEIPEHEFRRYHLCQWVKAPSESWLADKPGAWDACRGKAEIIPGQGKIVVSIDASLRHDSTAVVVTQKRDDGKFPVKAHLITPTPDHPVDHLELFNKIVQLLRQYNTKTVVFDPRFMELIGRMLEEQGFLAIRFDQSPERMVPACKEAYESILLGLVEHDGDPEFADHVNGAVWTETDRGLRVSKGKSRGPIDGCVSMIMGLKEVNRPDTAPAVFSSF